MTARFAYRMKTALGHTIALKATTRADAIKEAKRLGAVTFALQEYDSQPSDGIPQWATI